MRKILLAALALFMPFNANAACMDSDAAAAEAAIKVHSELMVIAVTCKYGPGNVSLFDLYGNFGKRNNAALRTAESNIVRYYKSNGKAGIPDLDRLRTQMGNKYSTEASFYDTQQWCNTVAPKLIQAAYWTPGQFQQASAERARAESSLPICGGVAVQTVAASVDR